jgi:integrase
MGGLEVKNLCQKRGRFYYRRKVNGKDEYIRLPAPWEAGHAEAYQRAAHEETRSGAAPGSIAALVAAYKASPEYKLIPAATTRANYLRYLDMIVEEHGHRTVAGVRVAMIYKMRDSMADKPGKANNWLTVFKALMSFAAKKDWRPDNPALGITALPIGEHEPWPADVLEKALERASPMTRLAIVTGLCSGARIGDCVRMQHGWIRGGIMEFVAEKNKVDVAVPVHPFWIEEIAKVERRSVTILYDRSGKPFASRRTLGERITDLMKAIGHEGYSFHGLRKNAACYLAELGLSDTEIGAICGMTPETVRHYTKRKRAFMIARGAADRVTKGDVLQLKGGRR